MVHVTVRLYGPNTKYVINRKRELQGTTYQCVARLNEIHAHRKWYYESCTKCRKKVRQEDNIKRCTDHGPLPTARLMYCVNATIVDNTMTTPVVFFNDSMVKFLQIECTKLIEEHGLSDQKSLPPPMQELIGQQRTFQLQHQTADTYIVIDVLETPVTQQEPTSGQEIAANTLTAPDKLLPITQPTEITGPVTPAKPAKRLLEIKEEPTEVKKKKD